MLLYKSWIFRWQGVTDGPEEQAENAQESCRHILFAVASAAVAGLAVGFQTLAETFEEILQRKNLAATAGFQIDVKDVAVGIQMLFDPFFTFSTVVLDMRARRAKSASLNILPSTGTVYCNSAMYAPRWEL